MCASTPPVCLARVTAVWWLVVRRLEYLHINYLNASQRRSPCVCVCAYTRFQALLRGALAQQSAVILVCMAIDRYICAMFPHKYDQYASKKVRIRHSYEYMSGFQPPRVRALRYIKHILILHALPWLLWLWLQGCVAILSVAWTLCLTLFGMLVLPKGEHLFIMCL